MIINYMCAKSLTSGSLSNRKITFTIFFGNSIFGRVCENYHKINYAFVFVVSLPVGHVAVETFASLEKFENGRLPKLVRLPFDKMGSKSKVQTRKPPRTTAKK